jgi:hypothetical protein
MHEINEEKLVTRAQFLGIIGSVAAGLFLMRFVDSKKMLPTVLSKNGTSTVARSGYGNQTYGGKMS